jgi:hypothetical protein
MSEEEENAAELEFGPEFKDPSIQYLTNDEVFFLLSKRAEGTGSSSEYEITISEQTIYFIFSFSTLKQAYTYLEKVTTTRVVDDLAGLASELAM